MDYTFALAFLDGIITFISPCLLPMLPVFILYFAGDGEPRAAKTLRNALGFVLGFTLIFLALGAFAGTLGRLLVRYRTALNLVSGAVVVLMGLSFMGLFRLPMQGRQNRVRIAGFFSAVLFGMIFSISWTPCLSATLGAALMLAAQRATVGQGVLMLLCYSLGLGVPFVLSAALIEQLKGAFGFLKRHMAAVNRISGGLLVLVGILMATGLMGRWMDALT